MSHDAWIPAYVGLGSNLDDPERQVLLGLDRLRELPGSLLVSRSSLYVSPPMGPIAQPDFVNAAAGLLTRLSPLEMLVELKSLETGLGRAPAGERWGPRRIDLDLLVHGTSRLRQPGLELPHPGIAERAFVLAPLAEIAPELEVPGLGKVQALLEKLDTHDVVRRHG
jgi:2-amino-4-hydroxy-6-hydroxymethyldihydropteridine diphosphokinase